MPLKLKKGTFDIEGVGMLIRGSALVEGEDFTFRGKGTGVIVEESPLDRILPLFQAGVPHKELLDFIHATLSNPNQPNALQEQRLKESGLDKWLARGATASTLIATILAAWPT